MSVVWVEARVVRGGRVRGREVRGSGVRVEGSWMGGGGASEL